MSKQYILDYKKLVLRAATTAGVMLSESEQRLALSDVQLTAGEGNTYASWRGNQHLTIDDPRAEHFWVKMPNGWRDPSTGYRNKLVTKEEAFAAREEHRRRMLERSMGTTLPSSPGSGMSVPSSSSIIGLPPRSESMPMLPGSPEHAPERVLARGANITHGISRIFHNILTIFAGGAAIGTAGGAIAHKFKRAEKGMDKATHAIQNPEISTQVTAEIMKNPDMSAIMQQASIIPTPGSGSYELDLPAPNLNPEYMLAEGTEGEDYSCGEVVDVDGKKYVLGLFGELIDPDNIPKWYQDIFDLIVQLESEHESNDSAREQESAQLSELMSRHHA